MRAQIPFSFKWFSLLQQSSNRHTVIIILKFYLIFKCVCVSSPPNELLLLSGIVIMTSVYFGTPTTSNIMPFVPQTLSKCLFTKDHGRLVHLQIILYPMSLSRCTDWFLGYLQNFSYTGLSLSLSFRLGKWFQQMSFLFFIQLSFTLVLARVQIGKKNNRFQGNSTKIIIAVIAHFEGVLSIEIELPELSEN